MRCPPVGRLYASVSRPNLPAPYEFEYVLWYHIPLFPVLVRISAHTPVP